MYLASLLGVPRPGSCAGLAGTAVSDFRFTDSLWQVITALSPGVSRMSQRHFLP